MTQGTESLGTSQRRAAVPHLTGHNNAKLSSVTTARVQRRFTCGKIFGQDILALLRPGTADECFQPIATKFVCSNHQPIGPLDEPLNEGFVNLADKISSRQKCRDAIQAELYSKWTSLGLF